MKNLSPVAAVLLLLVALPADAQRPEMVPGYVVTLAGDTLRGDIAQLPDAEAVQRVAFRVEGETEVQSLGPVHVAAYGTKDGRRYVAHSLIPSYEGRLYTLFLQELVRGPVTLYTYVYTVPSRSVSDRGDLMTDRNLFVRFAVEEDDGGIIPLYMLEWREAGGTMHVRRDDIFQRTLAEVFAGCEPVANRTARVRYRRSDLVGIVTRFNECIGGESFVHDDRVARPRLGLSVGATLRGGLGAAAVVRQSDGDIADGTMAPYAGILVEIISARLPGRTGIAAELALKWKGTSAEEHPALYPLQAYHYNHPIIGLSLGVTHAMDTRVSPYINVGATTGYLVGESDPVRVGMFRIVMPYSWESGFYGEIGARAFALGPGDVVLGIRGEFTRFTHGPVGLRSSSGSTENPEGHRSRSAHLVLGFRF